MRNCAVLLLLWGIAWPAMAAKTMSIEQMEQMLVKLHGKPDGKVAGELEDVHLTERVSGARLARWEADFPGSRTREALMKLADESAFLNPPAADVLRDPPPDEETQRQMLELAAEYIKTTMTRLPDFYATRETTHFEDARSQETIDASGANPMGTVMRAMRVPEINVGRADYKPLHSAGMFSSVVTYRDGKEVRDADTGAGKKKDQPAVGLTTSGEFGPFLEVVMGDAMRSQVKWAHWEQGASEPVAVFGYTVPENQSNFMVQILEGAKTEQAYPGYHGEIAIDPATGEILRISAVADLAPPYERMLTALMVEYAGVTIGDQSYVCPAKGVAFSKVPVAGPTAPGSSSDVSTVTVQTELNDVTFTNYHLFRAEAHKEGGG